MTQPTPDPVVQVEASMIMQLLKKEPVLAGYLAVWILTNVGALLVGHTHLVDAATWGTIATSVTPILSALILGGLAWLTRKYVEPIIKKVVN